MSQYLSAEGLGLTPEDISVATFKKALAEGIAVLLFVFLGAGTVVITQASQGLSLESLLIIAIAHGLAIALLVAATAGISGGHVNPAVTFSAVITGRMKLGPGIVYVALQLVGAVCGALLLQVIIADPLEGTLGAHAISDTALEGTGAAVLLEAVLTFVLVFVVFSTAMDPRSKIANVAPLVIGFAILVDHLIGVPLTGASMNPARTFGPALVAGEWDDHWVYWAGPGLGAALAGMTYMLLFWDREEPVEAVTDVTGVGPVPEHEGHEGHEHHPRSAEGHAEGHIDAAPEPGAPRDDEV